MFTGKLSRNTCIMKGYTVYKFIRLFVWFCLRQNSTCSKSNLTEQTIVLAIKGRAVVEKSVFGDRNYAHITLPVV